MDRLVWKRIGPNLQNNRIRHGAVGGYNWANARDLEAVQYTDERKRTMELVSKRIWGFPLMDRKCNTEELSSTRIKTIVFQFIFVFKFCLPERLLTFMVSSHPATLLPWVSKVFFLPTDMVRLGGEARSAE